MVPSDVWTDGLPPQPLTPADVHIVRIPLDGTTPARERLDALDETEQDRAHRFVFDRDRRRFVVSHAALRAVLGHCLDVRPREIRFRTGSNGKPALDAIGGDVGFNLSHAGEYALIAIASQREIGIDIEQIRPIDAFTLAERFFSRGEARRLAELPHDVVLQTFYRCWTRKESFVKALGDGLSFALDRFSVSLDDSCGPLPIVCDDPVVDNRWTMIALPAPPGYAAAVTFTTNPWTLKLWAPTSLPDIERPIRESI